MIPAGRIARRKDTPREVRLASILGRAGPPHQGRRPHVATTCAPGLHRILPEGFSGDHFPRQAKGFRPPWEILPEGFGPKKGPTGPKKRPNGPKKRAQWAFSERPPTPSGAKSFRKDFSFRKDSVGKAPADRRVSATLPPHPQGLGPDPRGTSPARGGWPILGKLPESPVRPAAPPKWVCAVVLGGAAAYNEPNRTPL